MDFGAVSNDDMNAEQSKLKSNDVIMVSDEILNLEPIKSEQDKDTLEDVYG